MQAVILAAGIGERLRPFSEKLPKCLITIGEKTLLEYSLNALKKNGLKEIIIVVGFLQEAIKQRFGEDYNGVKITYVSNDEYDKTGNMYSLSKAKDAIGNNDIILLEADLLYDPKAIEITLSARYEDFILVTDLSNSGDEVYICVEKNQKVIELGKNIPDGSKKNAIGEFIGITKFSGEFLDKLFKKAEEDYEKGELTYHCEECAFATSKLGHPVYAVLCKDLAWTDIDNENDLKRAKEKIYPRIRRVL